MPSPPGGVEPPLQAPPAQVSPVVQTLPSSQEAVLSTCTQPRTGLHESVVQAFPSSQAGGGPPAQIPLTHASPVVHASPSSQDAPPRAPPHLAAGGTSNVTNSGRNSGRVVVHRAAAPVV